MSLPHNSLNNGKARTQRTRQTSHLQQHCLHAHLDSAAGHVSSRVHRNRQNTGLLWRHVEYAPVAAGSTLKASHWWGQATASGSHCCNSCAAAAVQHAAATASWPTAKRVRSPVSSTQPVANSIIAASHAASKTVLAAAATSRSVCCPVSTDSFMSPADTQWHQSPAQAIGTPLAANDSRHVWLPEKQLWVPSNSSGASAVRDRAAAYSNSMAPLQRVYMAAAATRGHKQCMEDRHVLAALDPSCGVQQAHGPVGLERQVSVAAVFDGHAGYATAAYAAQHIPQLLHEALSGKPARSAGGPRVPHQQLLGPGNALSASFNWFDRWWADARCDPSLTEHGWDDSGSTAVVGLVSGQQLVVANAGDSVAVLARGGSSQRLSVEHRLDNVAEAERVLEAGGRVVSFKPGAAPRVMGNSSQTRFKGSMVTRSLGDFAFKHPQALISAEPYVAQEDLTARDKLVVLTSDGVTDVLPDDDMLEVAMRAMEQTQQMTNSGQALAKAAAVAIMNAALEAGSTDNITVALMLLDWGGEYAEEQ